MPKSSNAFTGGRPAQRKTAKGGRRSGGASGFGRLLLGVFLGVCLSAAAAVAYFYFGKSPVAVSDKPALWEHLAETVSVRRRMSSEAKLPPFPASEEVFEAAAHIYRNQCAVCHGVPGREAAVGRQMLPHAPQFFGRDRRETSAKAVGELFWPTAFGIRRSGMPAYNHTLSNTQLWQLALLLHSANDELPDPVSNLLIATDQQPVQAPPVVLPLRETAKVPRQPLDKSHLAPTERPESRF